jgi:hypothetical protein
MANARGPRTGQCPVEAQVAACRLYASQGGKLWKDC